MVGISAVVSICSVMVLRMQDSSVVRLIAARRYFINEAILFGFVSSYTNEKWECSSDL